MVRLLKAPSVIVRTSHSY